MKCIENRGEGNGNSKFTNEMIEDERTYYTAQSIQDYIRGQEIIVIIGNPPYETR